MLLECFWVNLSVDKSNLKVFCVWKGYRRPTEDARRTRRGIYSGESLNETNLYRLRSVGWQAAWVSLLDFQENYQLRWDDASMKRLCTSITTSSNVLTTSSNVLLRFFLFLFKFSYLPFSDHWLNLSCSCSVHSSPEILSIMKAFEADSFPKVPWKGLPFPTVQQGGSWRCTTLFVAIPFEETIVQGDASPITFLPTKVWVFLHLLSFLCSRLLLWLPASDHKL